MKTKKTFILTAILVAMCLQTPHETFGQLTFRGNYIIYGYAEYSGIAEPAFFYSNWQVLGRYVYSGGMMIADSVVYGWDNSRNSVRVWVSANNSSHMFAMGAYFVDQSGAIGADQLLPEGMVVPQKSHNFTYNELRYRPVDAGFLYTASEGFSLSSMRMSVCPNHNATARTASGETTFRRSATAVLQVDGDFLGYVAQDFIWEYSLDGTNFHRRQPTDFSGRSISVRFQDIPGAELGKPIYFRLRNCSYLGISRFANGSQALQISFLDELPAFQHDLYTATVRCPGQAPQALNLQFNRALRANEVVTNVYLFQGIVNGRPQNRTDLTFTRNTDGITVNFNTVFSDGDYSLMMEGTFNGSPIGARSTTVRIANPAALVFETSTSPSSGTEYHEGIESSAADGKIEISIKNYRGNSHVTFQGVQYNGSEITLSNLTPGDYSARISYNSSQCAINHPITIGRLNKSLKAHIEKGMPISCAGGSNASIQAVVERVPNTGAVSYVWYKNEKLLPNQTQSFLENLSVGNYKVVAKLDGLQSSFSFFVDEPKPLVSTVKSINHLLCGNTNGHIHIATTGGTLPYSYTWNTGQTTDSIGELDGGIYNYVVRDARGCETSGEIELLAPKPLEIKLVEAVEQSYFGSYLGVIVPSENNGSIHVSAEFGTPPYRFEWSNGATDSILKNLSFGEFHLTVSDYHSCEQSLTVQLPQRLPLVATIQKLTDISCFESNDAVLEASISGGVPPYTYRWKHTDDTALQQVGLSIGTYKFEVIDSLGVRSFDTIHISQPEPLHVVLSADSVSGWGASDGSTFAVASGGTPPYTVEWGSSTATSLSNLPAGLYHVRVTDANGCWLEDSISVGSPDSLTLVSEIYHCTYFGAIQSVLPAEPDDGRINTHTEGGVKPYNYQWFYENQPNEWTELLSKKLPNIDSLTGGRYALLVTDAKGYTVSDTFEILKKRPLVTTILATSPLCFGRLDGMLEALVTGGTLPYSYRWNLGDSTPILQHLTIGHYSVLVQDSLGVQSTFELVLTQPEPLTMDYIASPITQHGEKNGAVFTVVKGGIQPYAYLWTNPDTLSFEPQISNLGAGIYVFQVTDLNGCVLSTSFAKNDPDALEISAHIKPLSYLGSTQGRMPEQPSDGEVYLTVSGGFPPYEYLWSNNAKMPYLTGLSEGSYAVKVTDIYGNEAFGVFEITSTEPLMLTVNQDVLIACYGDFTAQLTAHVFGGNPPYAYIWSTEATTHVVEDLPVGLYDLEVIDSLGVTANFSIFVNEPTPLNVATDVTNPQCPNPENGAIRLFVSGGIPTYQYLWTTGEQTSQRTQLSDGVYEVMVSDANGCSKNHTFTLQTPLTAHIEQHDFIRCFGDSNVTLELVVCGGVYPYEILWNTGDTTLFLYERKSGFYSAKITDAIGNVYAVSFEVLEPLPLSVSGFFTHPSCFEENDGRVEIFVEGGTFPYLYRWSNLTTSSELTDLSGGTYNVFVTDRNGCQITYSATLVEPEKLLVNLGYDRTLCRGQVFSIVLPDDKMTYVWQKNGAFFETGNFAMFSETGEYTVIAEDEIGCKAFDTLQVKTVPDLLIAEFWHSHEAVVGEDFVVANIGQTPFDFVTWTIAPDAQIVSQNDDYFVVRFSDAGAYQISLTVHKNGCFDEEIGFVNVISEHESLRLKSIRKSTLSDLKLFPNPANDQFTFSVKAPQTAALRWILVNVSAGTVVLFGQAYADSDGLVEGQVLLPVQLRGTHVFRIFTEHEQISEQLIIQ